MHASGGTASARQQHSTAAELLHSSLGQQTCTDICSNLGCWQACRNAVFCCWLICSEARKGPATSVLTHNLDIHAGWIPVCLHLSEWCSLVALCHCSFYPVYPAAPGTMLDSSRGSLLHLPCTPDILITPSDLSAFAKPLPEQQSAATAPASTGEGAGMGVLVINPGRLAKGAGGGTFAFIQIGPLVAGGDAEAAKQCSALLQRCKTDIVRI